MKIDIKVPAAGESVTEADIASWFKSTGDFVEMDEAILELETDKASMELNAEAAGTLAIMIEAGETVKVGDTIGQIDTEKVGAPPKDTAPIEQATAESAAPQIETSTNTHYAAGHPSPSAAKLIAEKNIDPATISGSGKNGRITKGDALEASAAPTTKPTPTPQVPKPEPTKETAQTEASGTRGIRREKMSRLRRVLSKRLVSAQQTSALLTTFNEVDMTAVMNIRKLYKEKFKKKYEVNLGFMSFFTKAATEALQAFPVLNGAIEDEQIVYHDYCDIGIAVSTPKGLVVPVLKNAETLSFNQIEKQILDFALRGRDGKITTYDLEGGTFTITNGGTFGSMMSTPIINFPQSAILGMHNIIERPMAVNGQVEIRPMMYLAVTYDHRIIDGSDAVQFLVMIKQLLEDPTRLLIGI